MLENLIRSHIFVHDGTCRRVNKTEIGFMVSGWKKAFCSSTYGYGGFGPILFEVNGRAIYHALCYRASPRCAPLLYYLASY
jgi:hypothetical protein